MGHTMRYHVTLQNKETTVTIDDILSELLVLRLGYDPDSTEATSAARLWLQQRLADHRGLPHVSQWLQKEIVQMIAAKELLNAHRKWCERMEKQSRYALATLRSRRPRRKRN